MFLVILKTIFELLKLLELFKFSKAYPHAWGASWSSGFIRPTLGAKGRRFESPSRHLSFFCLSGPKKSREEKSRAGSCESVRGSTSKQGGSGEKKAEAARPDLKEWCKKNEGRRFNIDSIK